MSNCQRTFDIVQNQRLRILTGTAACGRITGMADSDISVHFFQNLRCEHFIYQAHAFVRRHFSWSVRITYSNTAALLTSVLQCQQTIIYGRSHIPSVKIIDAEDTALFVQVIQYISLFHQVHSFHPRYPSQILSFVISRFCQ